MKVLIASVIMALGGLGAAVAGECKSDASCKAPARCVPVVGGKRCLQLCDPKAPKCPADHRCVKDGESQVCRPTNDALDLLGGLKL